MQFKICNILKKGFLYGVVGIASFLAINAVSIPLIHYINKNISQETKTVVFTSGYDNIGISKDRRIVSKTIDFFMYPPITLKQTLNGNRVDWISDASKEEFLEKLTDDMYENIILIGHGSKNSYSLSEYTIDNEFIKKCRIKKRYGEFLQYTCGTGNEPETLEDVLYTETKRTKKFEGIAWPNDLYVGAWEDVFTNNYSD